MQNELEKARTEKNYFAPLNDLKKWHAKEIKKLSLKHQDGITFLEERIQKILKKNDNYHSNQHEFINDIRELKKEKEVLMETS